MSLRASWILAGVVVAVSLAGGPAEAAGQAPPPPGGRAGAGSAPLVTPLELERWFDSYVLLQAQDTLKLTDAQFPRFLSRLRVLQETRRRHLQARRQILNTLGRLLKATPFDEAQARGQLTALRELDTKAADDLLKAYESIDEVLNTAQQAKFRVFEEMVERRKIDLLMRARQLANGPGQPGPSAVR
jgi:Spy/CpxP family protein refolding chaperone